MAGKLSDIRSILPDSLAYAAAYSVGLWGLYLQPQLLVPLMERFGVSDPVIGRLYMVENFVFFIALLLTAIPVTKYSRVKMAFLGSILVIIASIGSAYTGSIGALMICRAIVSIGAGIMSGAATASASASDQPERVFAIGGMVYLLIFSLGRSLVPMGLEHVGIKGIFLITALYSAAVIPSYIYLLPPVKSESASADFFKLLLDAPYRLLAILAMTGLFIYELGQNAVFTYMDKLGEDAGVDGSERGMAYLLSMSMNLLGGGVATWMGARYGRFWPLVCGLGLNITSGAMFTLLENPDYYIFLLFFWNITYSFTAPYISGTLACLDKEGRWAVAGEAFWNFSQTPGPIIATLIVANMGYNPLAIWVLTSGAVGMALFCYTGRQSDKLGLVE